MQRARAALGRGAATVALAELEAFGRNSGWRQLSVEASLLRIEALAAAGRTEQARSQARRFVEQHPNNPLVDRAQKFATGQAADAAPSSVKTENRK
jgi:outer membrane protein assembly factor BamD (BamD/ComL family)